MPREQVATVELMREMAALSGRLYRRIGVMLDRRGHVAYVCLGDAHRLPLPDLGSTRTGPGMLRGLRLVHTSLNNDEFGKNDLTELVRQNLDLSLQVNVGEDGALASVVQAHLLPTNTERKRVEVSGPMRPNEINGEFLEFIGALEQEFASTANEMVGTEEGERAILVGATTGSLEAARESMDELEELTRSAGVAPIDRVVQRRAALDSKTLVGKGMLEELALRVLRLRANCVIFDQNLKPVQARNVSRSLPVKIIDRTQLILDIFAQRAVSREGKLQVELARLKYMLPHLTYARASLEQIRGGIGSTRGVGEMKSELDRRYVRDRVHRLEQEIADLSKHRGVMRAKRSQSGTPTVAIVGYTNAGKSTLMNALTGADVFVKDQLFATLDTTARKLWLPALGREVVITDTVGFLRDLPKDLVAAFKATLEELREAALLLHVADASNPRVFEQTEAVTMLLGELGVARIPKLLVFNKKDLVDVGSFGPLARHDGGLLVSALDPVDVDRVRAAIGEAIGTPRHGSDGGAPEDFASTGESTD
ncbi:MAG: GTPase HflX [Planctomycetes bacterium]|nr:GTPase HflX [Planctomycetota bacterium]